MPSRSETTRHEAPDARSAATCLASTAVRGRPSRFPFDWASRSAASPALPRHPEPNPCLRPQHSPLGRCSESEEHPRPQHGVPSHAEVSECGDGVHQRQAELADLPPRQDCVSPPKDPSMPVGVLAGAFKQLRLGVLNIAGARVVPACRTDDKRNSPNGNRRTQRSCRRRTPQG